MNMRNTSAISFDSDEARDSAQAPWADALRAAVERLEADQGIPAHESRPYLEAISAQFAAVVAQWRKR
jgi:hypothetical protein